MGFISDLLLAGGGFGAAIYCYVLSRRLKALTTLDGGLGSAIAVLSGQVDDLTRAMTSAQQVAQGTSGRLIAQTERAEAASQRLELLIASLHGLPEPDQSPASRASPKPAAAALADDDLTDPVQRDAPPARARVLRRRAEGRAA